MVQLSSSPTPARVATAYETLIRQRARALAGKDARLTANESAPDPLVADAFSRTGKARPVVARVAAAAKSAMLAEATRVHGGDGRVSKLDAEKMSPVMAQGFLALRGRTAPSGDAIALNLGKLAEGLTFMSESDEPYAGFHVALAKSTPIDATMLKSTLDWSQDASSEPLPAGFQLQLTADDTAFSDTSGLSASEAAKNKAIDQAMKAAFVETTAVQSDGTTKSAKIWSVTPREEDSAHAAYYIFGRLANGDLVGLKTARTWT